MHESVMQFVRDNVHVNMVADKHVLEVGSYNVNGSARPLIEALKPASYLGTDMRMGPGVDVVYDIVDRPEVSMEGTRYQLGYAPIPYEEQNHYYVAFDLVVCCEVLEHVKNWRVAVTTLAGHVKPGGWLVLTTRSEGFPFHEYPNDFWRYSVADMQRIMPAVGLVVVAVESDTQAPGVFVVAQKPESLENIEIYRMPENAT